MENLGKLKERLKNPPKFMIKESSKKLNPVAPANPLVFGIDCDEVLAKFKTLAFKILTKITGKTYNEDSILEWDFNKFLTKEEVNSLWDYINDSPTFVNAIEPFEDAQLALPKLLTLGEIFIVTAPLIKCDDFMRKRNSWLFKHFKIEPANICYLKRKEFFGCDVFIDDHPENVIAWRKRNSGIAILWEKPYNNIPLESEFGKIIRTCDWDEVLEVSKKFVHSKQEKVQKYICQDTSSCQLLEELGVIRTPGESTYDIKQGEKRYVNGIFAERITKTNQVLCSIPEKCQWKNLETGEYFYSNANERVFLELQK